MTEQEAQAEALRRWPLSFPDTTGHTAAPRNYGLPAQRAAFVAGAAWERSRVVEAAPSDTDLRTAVFEAIADRLGEHPRASNHEIADSGEYETKLNGLFDVEELAEYICPAVWPMLATSQPVHVEATAEEVVQVFWYEHDCEWLSKYCDEHHRRSSRVSRAALGGGE